MLPQLKFKDEYYEQIVKGFKIQTTRLKLKPDIGPGVICDARFVYDDGRLSQRYILPIKIIDITQKLFKDLDVGDASRENLGWVMGLKNELKNIYPELLNNDTVYCIKFRLLNLDSSIEED